MAGKHRAPSKTSKRLATVATAAAIPAVAVTGFVTPQASAQPPDAIAHCESGGDHKAENSSSTASGKWQFIDGTWAAYGGTQFAPRASGATEAEQDKVAARAYAAEGTSPWNASKSCWGGKSNSSSKSSDDSETKVEKKKPVQKKTEKKDTKPSIDGLTYKAPKKKPVDKTQVLPAVSPKGQFTPGGTGPYVVKSGDTLTHLAKANHTTVDHLANRNKNIVEHHDWIFEGERLHLR